MQRLESVQPQHHKTRFSCLQTLGIRDYQDKVAAHGLVYSVMPIIDMAIPESVHDAFTLISSISEAMTAGQSVLVHCRQGIGRAGMIAACVLLHLGCATSPHAAIEHVRQQRHKLAVQTSRQEQFVQWYAENVVTPISSLPERPPFASRAHCSSVSATRRSSKPEHQQVPDTQNVDGRTMV